MTMIGPEHSRQRHKSGDRYHPYSQQGSHKSHGYESNITSWNMEFWWLDSNKGKEARQSHRSNQLGSQQSRVPLRVILTLFATHVDVDTQESVVVLAGTCFNVPELVIFSGTMQEEHWC
ncbi:hypothetical protein Tco_0089614 [Tanacetum coccineum]